MATSGLRPLSVGEILDAGIKVVTRHWKPLMACTLGLVTPVALLNVLILASISPESLELVPETPTTPTEEIELPDTAVLVGIGVVGVMSMLALIIAYSACFKAVCDAWLGTRPNAKESVLYGLRRLWKVFLLGVVWFFFVLVAWIPCFVPLIYFGVAWCLSLPVMLFEGAGPFASLKRSFNLIKGRWWASFLIVVVCYFLVSILGAVLQFPFLIVAELVAGESAIANGAAQVIGYSLSFGITVPYYAAVLTVLYFDQRVRKEAFDLQLIAESLGTERDPDAPLPGPMFGEEYTDEQKASAPYWPPPPGWVPPPPSQPASPWSSESGWTAPSSEPPLWGAGESPPPEDPLPADPLPDSPWMTPKPREDDDERKDSDWQPPESPRGPGGL